MSAEKAGSENPNISTGVTKLRLLHTMCKSRLTVHMHNTANYEKYHIIHYIYLCPFLVI